MPDTILIAYATKYGSTKEVAEAIGKALAESGRSVAVVPAAEVRDLRDYTAVVFGAPFYVGNWPKDARAFLDRNKAALEALPVALFTLGPISANDDMAEASKQTDAILEKLGGWLKPRATVMFVGAYDPDRLKGLDKLLAKLPASPLHGQTRHDDRDWDAIRAWAQALPEALGA